MTGQLLEFVQYQPNNMHKPEEKDYTWIGRNCASNKKLGVVLSNKGSKNGYNTLFTIICTFYQILYY